MDTSTNNNQPVKENDYVVQCETAPIEILEFCDNKQPEDFEQESMENVRAGIVGNNVKVAPIETQVLGSSTVFAELSSPAIAVTEITIPDHVNTNDMNKIDQDYGPSVKEPPNEVDVLTEDDRTEYIYYKEIKHEPEQRPKNEDWNTEFAALLKQSLEFDKGFKLGKVAGQPCIKDDKSFNIATKQYMIGELFNKKYNFYAIVVDDNYQRSRAKFIPRGYERIKKTIEIDDVLEQSYLL